MDDIKDAKIIIINCLDEEYDLKDGNIAYIGNIREDSFHTDIMIDYGISVYGDHSIFGLLKNMNLIPNVPSFFLTDYGNIVILSIIGGKKLLLYLPEEISKCQFISLRKVLEKLDYLSIEVNHNLKLIDGLVESDTILGNNDKDFIFEVFDKGFKTKKRLI